jgi:hypothetical protein
MYKRFDTGKQPYDATKDTQATVPSHKPLDVIRLSSESTRENPRLLGGTLQEAQDFLKKLEPYKKQAFKDFTNLKKEYRKQGDTKATQTARLKYPLGYDLFNEYMRIHRQPEKGESSTTNKSSTEEDPHWTDAIYEEWNDL